ncbi:MAG: malectin domain-containing carbohydrate-binding protein [bacterium]
MRKAKHNINFALASIVMFGLFLHTQQLWAQGSTLKFSATGDYPYGSNEIQKLIADIDNHNLYSPSDFFFHVGDILAGSESCQQARYDTVAAILKDSALPAFIIPGDNETVDCSNPTQAWQWWTSNFFYFEQHFCMAPPVEHQTTPNRPENIAFLMKGVLMIGINLVSGASQSDMDDAAAWVDFQMLDKGGLVRSAVVFGHVDPKPQYDYFFNAFENSSATFGKPVLYVNGNDHKFKFDQPFSLSSMWRLQVNEGGAEDPVEVTVSMSPTAPFSYIRNPWSNNPQPFNVAPCVDTGPDQTILITDTATLQGWVTDDGVPQNPGATTVAWTQLSGPGTAVFANPNNALTTATFNIPGLYQLQLTGNDGQLQNSDALNVTVDAVNPSFTVNDVSVSEGNSGTSTPATFTVTLSNGDGSTFSVNYATQDGTATDGLDYNSTSGTLTFSNASGTVTQTLPVTVLGDDTDEPDETFFVKLSGTTNADIIDTTGIGTILDDDLPPPAPPVITSTPTTDATSGLPYHYDDDDTVEATGSQPITFSATGPAGFSIDPNTGFVSWTPTPADVGPQAISIIATNAFGTDTQNFTIQVDPYAVRINAGSATAYTDSNGDLFVADQPYSAGNFGYVAGSPFNFNTPISGTTDDPLYQTLHGQATSFQYKFDVPAAGFYDITLYLAAPIFGTGNFIFDVSAEGALVFNDLDVEAQAGGTYIALIKNFSVNVTDGTLDLDFQTVNKASILNAIAVVPGSGPTPTPDIDVTPLTLNFNQVITGQNADMTATISNTGTASLTVSAFNLDNSEFSLVSPPALPLTIAPGASQNLTVRFSPTVVASQTGNLDILSDDPDEGTVTVSLQGQGIAPPALDVFRINAGGTASYTDGNGDTFVADQAYTAGSYGYSGGLTFNVPNPIGGTTDDLLYQDLRAQGQSFMYNFDVSSAGTFDVTLYLMAPVYNPTSGNFIMDVWSEGILVFDDLDVDTQAGGTFQALIKTFSVSVTDGTLNIQFLTVNKAVLVSAIAVVQQPTAPDLAKRKSAEDQFVNASPGSFELFQNYPNPFNPETNIRFSIPKDMYLTLKIYNILGEEVRTLVDGFQQAGNFIVHWDTRNDAGIRLPSGTYIYRLQGGGEVSVKEMILLR